MTNDDVATLFLNPGAINTGSCSFSEGYGTRAVPTAAVKLVETDVGFRVSGQDAKA